MPHVTRTRSVAQGFVILVQMSVNQVHYKDTATKIQTVNKVKYASMASAWFKLANHALKVNHARKQATHNAPMEFVNGKILEMF